ncbi:DUF2786 domain-containing protein [Actinocrispum wychmicini]|uniref:Uncharacterized protein DUF2786 n=1 Tax=Actinocrispum wychmicini TaxID=1213861 RepID=A0A4R2JEY5_9PSEU|nr:DUF2786 domain-containing protein [Actinocrispum wychmicini]TCO58271.1 uncharacterized protein DUF2786 [Actinocrispum wychmicini]
MGKRNQEKRAAKKRKRRHPGDDHGVPSGPHGPDCTCDEDDFRVPPAGQPAELVGNALLEAARAHAMGDTRAAAACAAELTAHERRVVGTGAGIALSTMFSRLWKMGWLPVDVWEGIRRTVDSAAAGIVVDMIAEDIARYALSTVDDRWLAQVRWLGADVWWERDRPYLPQWAEREGVGFEQALLTTIALLAALMMSPELPRIVPPPGTATRRSTASVSGVDQKILARVRGLLAKAESTQFGAEAEALSAKAQELMNRYAFERALVDADSERLPEAASIRLWLDNPYVEAKANLVAAIASANRCRSVFYAKIGFVALVGEEMDLEITELLATSLLVQATRAMIAEGSHTTRSGTSRTRSFRRSFLIAYAVRVGERLEKASARAHDPAEDARLLPVLANRSRLVDETFQTMFSRTVERTTSVTNGAGWQAGRAAADRADLAIERQTVTSGS